MKLRLRFLAALVCAICILQIAWGQSSARDKVSGEVLAHQEVKRIPPGRSAAEHRNALREQGLNPANLDAEDCALYATRPLRTDEIAPLAARGIRVTPQLWIPPVPGKHPFGFHLATVDFASLDFIRADSRFVKLESTEFSHHPQNDLGKIMINADDVQNGNGVTARTGVGVKIAVADSGVDLTHADFPVPVEAYDMTDGTSTADWGTNVANTVTPHGTHVAGTALGRGTLSGGKYKGAAPSATFYFYKIGDDATGSASTTDEIEAINRALAVGAKIFTMSYGGFSTYMDGSEAAEQAIDAAVAGGMTVFVSAGNDGTAALHDSVSVAPGTTSGSFGFSVTNPSGSLTYTTQQQIRVIWRDGNGGDGNMTLACTNLGAGETLTEAFSGVSPRGTDAKRYVLTPSLSAGVSKTYTFTLQNTAVSGSTPLVHCYRVSGIGTFTSPDATYIVSSPAIADGAIAVGAWTHRKTWTDYKGNNWQFPTFTVGTLAPFSSQGPRIDGVVKPDIVAPGAATISARDSSGSLASTDSDIIDNDGLNLNGSGPANYYLMSGTSMASPMAAGAAALVLEQNPSLTPAQLKHLLTSTSSNSGSPNGSVGYGLIDVLAAVQATDAMSVVASGLAATGSVGGPFSPTSGTYTLTNNSGSSLNWTASKTQTWTTLSATSGSLAGAANTVVTISLNSNANALPSGAYSDTVTITNTSTGFVLTFSVSLTVGTPHATLFDSYTGGTPAILSNTPRTFMGFPMTLASIGGTSNITVAAGTAYLVAISNASFTNLRLNVTFWGTASGATSGATPAFSNSLGTYSFDLGPTVVTASTFYPITFTLPTPVVLPGQTGGITINWQGDTGSGLASTDNLTSLVRYGSALAAGSLSVGTAGTYGFYDNLSGQTNGNFPGSDFVAFGGGLTNQCLALQLFGSPAAPMALTSAATSVGPFVATLNASVNPAGASTTASFQYGTTTGYGSTAAITLSPATGTTAQSVTANLTGLAANTLYHFRVTATNSYGTTVGRDLTFTTPANTLPTITGAVAGQAVNDNATISPFAGVTIGDTDGPAQTLSVSVALDTAAKGSFTTLNGFTNAGSGVYTFSGTAAAATTAIRGLVFTPTANRMPAGATETTTFTISVNDTSGPVTNNTTTVVSTSMNDFTTWQQSKFTQAELADSNVSGPNAVFGLDGLSNLIKYALGLEPKTNITTGLPAVTVVGSEWYFTYTRPVGLTDITYSVQVSTDLTTWTTSGVSHDYVSSSGGFDTYRGRYPLASATNAFFRLNVTQN